MICSSGSIPADCFPSLSLAPGNPVFASLEQAPGLGAFAIRLPAGCNGAGFYVNIRYQWVDFQGRDADES